MSKTIRTAILRTLALSARLRNLGEAHVGGECDVLSFYGDEYEVELGLGLLSDSSTTAADDEALGGGDGNRGGSRGGGGGSGGSGGEGSGAHGDNNGGSNGDGNVAHQAGAGVEAATSPRSGLSAASSAGVSSAGYYVLSAEERLDFEHNYYRYLSPLWTTIRAYEAKVI